MRQEITKSTDHIPPNGEKRCWKMEDSGEMNLI